jgi:hypothetical protein
MDRIAICIAIVIESHTVFDAAISRLMTSVHSNLVQSRQYASIAESATYAMTMVTMSINGMPKSCVLANALTTTTDAVKKIHFSYIDIDR